MLHPPPWTCPGIDAAKRTARRIAWRVRNRRKLEELPALVAELHRDLERVRSENVALREFARVCRDAARARMGVD